jgi:hypothetical protein
MTNLKPCPICGKSERLKFYVYARYIELVCMNCMLTMFERYDEDDGPAHAEDALIARWNNRHRESALVVGTKRLARLVVFLADHAANRENCPFGKAWECPKNQNKPYCRKWQRRACWIKYAKKVANEGA